MWPTLPFAINRSCRFILEQPYPLYLDAHYLNLKKKVKKEPQKNNKYTNSHKYSIESFWIRTMEITYKNCWLSKCLFSVCIFVFALHVWLFYTKVNIKHVRYSHTRLNKREAKSLDRHLFLYTHSNSASKSMYMGKVIWNTIHYEDVIRR